MKANDTNIKDSLLEVGKEVTVNLKVLDKDIAEEILCTMYDQNKDKYGVEVQSWGFYDIQKAQKLRLEMIEKEFTKYAMNISNIMTMTDLRIIESNK